MQTVTRVHHWLGNPLILLQTPCHVYGPSRPEPHGRREFCSLHEHGNITELVHRLWGWSVRRRFTTSVSNTVCRAFTVRWERQRLSVLLNTVDVIIVEDDPYYFLQMGSYAAKQDQVSQAMHADPESWLSSLAPSFLRYVFCLVPIRYLTYPHQDRLPGPGHPSRHILQGTAFGFMAGLASLTFLLTRTQTIAPGSRLGFFTCNPRFAERFERAGEVSTQAPCGFGQVCYHSTHCLRSSYELR